MHWQGRQIAKTLLSFKNPDDLNSHEVNTNKKFTTSYARNNEIFTHHTGLTGVYPGLFVRGGTKVRIASQSWHPDKAKKGQSPTHSVAFKRQETSPAWQKSSEALHQNYFCQEIFPCVKGESANVVHDFREFSQVKFIFAPD